MDLPNIDAKLDEMELADTSHHPKIIEPLETTNDFVKSFGTVILQCRPANQGTQGTAFVVHKMKLYVRSSRFYVYARTHPDKKVFELDTDKRTLDIVVEWLHYPESTDLHIFSTERLIEILIIALTIRIPKLHNELIAIILNRHTQQSELFGAIPTFEPSPASLRRIYNESRKDDGVRKLVGYLFARAGKLNYAPNAGWEIDVSRDIEDWVRPHAKLNKQIEVKSEDFFMEGRYSGIRKETREETSQHEGPS